MKKKIGVLISMLVLMAVAVACTSENREFTMHKAGVYKGTKDPLLAKEQHQELINRLKMIQTDR